MGTTTKNLGLYKPAANDYYNVETDQNENFDKIDDALSLLNKQEIENLLGFNALNQEFILATLDDIKNLFPGSSGTSGSFDLGHISSDQTKIVNMMLLSNYNEYLQQKILQIKDFFNSLNSNKADKTTLTNYYTKIQTDNLLQNKVNNSVLDGYYNKTRINDLLAKKADKTIRVDVGDGLLGSGTLESNINITVDKLNVTEIQNLLNNWR